MQKDFDKWNKRKKEINKEEPNFWVLCLILNKEKFDEIRKAIRDLI